MQNKTLRDRIFSVIGAVRYASRASEIDYDRDLFSEVDEILSEVLPLVNKNEVPNQDREITVDDTRVEVYGIQFNHKIDTIKFYRNLFKNRPGLKDSRDIIASMFTNPVNFGTFDRSEKEKIFNRMVEMESLGIQCRCSDPDLEKEFKSHNASLSCFGLKGAHVNFGSIAHYLKIDYTRAESLGKVDRRVSSYMKELTGSVDLYPYLTELETIGVRWSLVRRLSHPY